MTVRSRDVYRLLLMNNHESHLTRQFLEYCANKKILSFIFFSHLTHRLQSLNLISFQQYKLRHEQTVNETVRMSVNIFDKIDFLTEIENIRRRTFKFNIIRTRWRDSDIRSFKFTEKLKKIRERSFSSVLQIYEEALAVSITIFITKNFTIFITKNSTISTTKNSMKNSMKNSISIWFENWVSESSKNSSENFTLSLSFTSVQTIINIQRTFIIIRDLRQQIENSINFKSDLSSSI